MRLPYQAVKPPRGARVKTAFCSALALLAYLMALCCSDVSSEVDPRSETSAADKLKNTPPFSSSEMPKAPSRHDVTISGTTAAVWASSELESVKASGRYSVLNAFDSNPKTAWVEGVDGNGENEFIALRFVEPVTVLGFALLPGYTKSIEIFNANSVPRKIEISAGDQRWSAVVPYVMEMGYEDAAPSPTQPRDMDCYPTADPINLCHRLFVFPEPVHSRDFVLRIEQALPGARYTDLAISEWTLLLEGRPSDDMLIDAAMRLLRAIAQSGSIPDETTADNLSIEDLDHKLVVWDPDRAWVVRYGSVPQQEEPVFRRVPEPGTEPAGAELFIRHTREAFLGAFLTLYSANNRHHILGATSESYGNGEWIELYPTITLNSDRKVTDLREVSYHDGAPGCHDVIPDVLSISNK